MKIQDDLVVDVNNQNWFAQSDRSLGNTIY